MIKVRHMAQVCREAMHAHSGTPHWDDLNDRQRRLSTSIVNFILANPNATPEACHNAWMGQMIHEEGFSFGLSDETAKTHPNLMPYAELPPQVQGAYAISIGVVRGLQDVGNRYINCAPQTTVDAVADAVTPPVAEPVETEPIVEPVAEPVAEPVEAEPIVEPIVEPVAEPVEAEPVAEPIVVEPTTQGDQGFVHFVGQNQPAESAATPESGDIAPGTDPASAE